MDRQKLTRSFVITAVLMPVWAQAARPDPHSLILYVAPGGRDSWSGHLSRPNSARSDGPVATVEGARNLIRRLKAAGRFNGPIDVRIEAGVYSLSQPFVLEPGDSGTAGWPITYEGVAGERPVLSGGTEIGEFMSDGRTWTTTLPGSSGHREYSALWANETRRTVARTPNRGYFTIAGLAAARAGAAPVDDGREFRFKKNDLSIRNNLADARVIVFHNWETSIHHVQSVDPTAQTITLTGGAAWPFAAGERYYIENVPEALDAPGEWYLDRATGRLSYLPVSGERTASTRLFVPRLTQLVLLKGDPAHHAFVGHVRFRNIRFCYTNYIIEPQGHSDGQAAVSVPATFEATGARDCRIEDCEIAHTGNYGIWLRTGSEDNAIVRCELHDLGAGGVRIGETNNPASAEEAVLRNTVDNCFIHDDGRLFRGAVAVFIARSSDNRVTHNDIGDTDYTGISVGWSWGYDPSSANHNILAYNHIHDIGRGELSDMGAIYTLGVSPGTVERGNVMHDIYCNPAGYGGWGVYTDEGSSGILIENNLVFNTSSGCFHQHYGENNILRNNIFAYGAAGILQRTRLETHNSFTFEHNLVVSNGSPFHVVTWGDGHYAIDHNLYWDYRDPRPLFFGMSWDAWRAAGRDTSSIIANPGFRLAPPGNSGPIFKGAKASDFDLKAPASELRIGFRPFSYSEAGLYGDPRWIKKARDLPRTRYYPPPPSPPSPIADGFEETPVGARAELATTVEEGKGDSIRVTDETAASGRQSLKFVDAPGLVHQYDPHLYYSTNWHEGTVREDVDLRFEAGCIMYHEWRDSSVPYHVGPGFRLSADGHITAGGQVIGTARPGQWVHLSLTCALGSKADGRFVLSLTEPGSREASIVRSLPCSPDFRTLNWLGYSMDGDQRSVMYLDNLSVRRVK